MKSQLLILLSHAPAPLSCADLSLATRRDKSAIVAALRGMIAKGVVDRVAPAEMDVMRYRLTPLGTLLAAAPKEPREPLRAILKVVLTESEERAVRQLALTQKRSISSLMREAVLKAI